MKYSGLQTEQIKSKYYVISTHEAVSKESEVFRAADGANKEQYYVILTHEAVSKESEVFRAADGANKEQVLCNINSRGNFQRK